MNVHFNRSIEAVRKPHECEVCGRKIGVGSPARYGSGVFDGYWYDQYLHPECEDAAQGYAIQFNCWDENYPWFQHYTEGDFDSEWLREHHPAVADRLGWALPDTEAAE